MTTLAAPTDPIVAITHPDPYPYYAELAATRPLYRDEARGMWIASSAAVVTAVLQHEQCRVRPIIEPVPAALLGSPAADIFRHLVRMNDGAGHCPFKQAVAATLESVDLPDASRLAARQAEALTARLRPVDHPEHIMDFAFQLPVHVVGSLLGVPDAMLPALAADVGSFVACLAPSSTSAQLDAGKQAAGRLLERFHALAKQDATDGLFATLVRQAREYGRNDPAVIIANAIGFLTQSYEATAGLIGNTLLRLARTGVPPAGDLATLIRQVQRDDPSVQNTRRFVAEDTVVAGQPMRAGDVILVVLAAASHDPTTGERTTFGFGDGRHACPGKRLATTIAEAGVARLLTDGLPLHTLADRVRFRPSVNARIPLFTGDDA